MSKIVANLIISTDDGDGDIIMELDDELNLDIDGEGGNTSFSPGDIVYFRIQNNSSSLKVEKILSTDGDIYQHSLEKQRNMQEQYLWIDDDTENKLSYKPSSALEVISYGNTATIKRTGTFKIISPITNGEKRPALTDIAYDSKFDIYKLITPEIELENDETYEVVIVLYTE